jgi:hypothetical protein
MNTVIGVSATRSGSGTGRKVIALVSALIVWLLVSSVLNRLLRLGIPGYSAAEPAMAFTVSMQWARLAIGAVTSLSAGYLLARVAPDARRLPIIFGAFLVAMFLPVHYTLWNKFPMWYHLTFLLTIVPLVVAGAQVGARKTASVAEGS